MKSSISISICLCFFTIGIFAQNIAIPKKAIEQGVEFLLKQQSTQGVWNAYIGIKVNENLRSFYSQKKPDIVATACVALTLLEAQKFLAKSFPQIDKACEFIISCQNDQGFIGKNNTRMIAHCLATQLLARYYMQTNKANVRRALANATKFIIDTQCSDGFWFYIPHREAKDNLATGYYHLQALYWAKQAGINIQPEVLKRASEALAKFKNAAGYGYNRSYNKQQTKNYNYFNSIGVYSQSLLAKMGCKQKITKAKLDPLKFSQFGGFYFLDGLYAHTKYLLWHQPGEIGNWYKHIAKELMQLKTANFWQIPRGQIFATAFALRVLLVPTEKYSVGKTIEDIEAFSVSELVSKAKQWQTQKKWQMAHKAYLRMFNLAPNALIQIENSTLPMHKYCVQQINLLPQPYKNDTISVPTSTNLKEIKSVVKTETFDFSIPKNVHFLEIPFEKKYHTYSNEPKEFYQYAQGYSLPVFDGNNIFISTGENVLAYSPTGKLWQTNFSHSGLFFRSISQVCNVILTEDTVYANIIAKDNHLQKHQWYLRYNLSSYIPRRMLAALDKKTGKTKWICQDNNLSFVKPLVVGNHLYVLAYNHQAIFNLYLIAIDTNSGKIIWRTFVDSGVGEINMFGLPVQELTSSKLAYANNKIYMVSNLGKVACVSANGYLQWAYSYPRVTNMQKVSNYTTKYFAPNWENRPPLIHNNTLLITPIDSDHIYCFNLDGKLLWKRQFKGFCARGIVYQKQIVIANKNALVFLNPHSGAIISQFAHKNDLYLRGGMVASNNKKLYIPSTKGVICFDLLKNSFIPSQINLEALQNSKLLHLNTGEKRVAKTQDVKAILANNGQIIFVGANSIFGYKIDISHLYSHPLDVAYIEKFNNFYQNLSNKEKKPFINLMSQTNVANDRLSKWEGINFAYLSNLAHIATLDLKSLPVTDDHLQDIGKLKALENLNLCNTKISDATIKLIANLPLLKKLSLNKTKISSSALAYLNKSLTSLNISGTDIDDSAVVFLTALKNLTFLDISNTKISEQKLSILRKMPNLAILKTNNRKLPDTLVVFDDPIKFQSKANKMVFIPGGEYQGKTIKDFYVSQFEISNGEYTRFVNNSDSATEKPLEDIDHPVFGISWQNTQEFCHWLYKRTGKKYRLLYLHEWQYVASNLGEDRKYPTGNTISLKQANFMDKNRNIRGSVAVGSYPPNELGIYDLAGNVWEWCQDKKDGQAYYLGGGYINLAHEQRIDNVHTASLDVSGFCGIRLALDAGEVYSKNKILNNKRDFTALYQQGLQAMAQKNWSKAIDYFLKAQKIPYRNKPKLFVKNLHLAQQNYRHNVKNTPNLIWQQKHTETIIFNKISYDGKLLITASWDKTVKIWDIKSKQLLATFYHPDYIYEIDIDKDSSIVTVASHRYAYLWDLNSKQLLYTFTHPSKVKSVILSQDKKSLITICRDQYIRIWDITSKQLTGTLSHPQVKEISLNKSGYIASLGAKEVHIWDIGTQKIIKTMPGNGASLVKFSPDGLHLALAVGVYVDLINIESGKRVLKFKNFSKVYDITFNQTGSHLVSIDVYGAMIWDIKPNRKFWQETLNCRFYAGKIASASIYGNTLAVAIDKFVLFFNFEQKATTKIIGHITPLAANISPDGEFYAIGSYNIVQLFAKSGKLIKTFANAHMGQISDIWIGPKGKKLASSDYEGYVYMWDVASGHIKYSFSNRRNVSYISLSNDGKFLATSEYETVKLFNTTTQQLLGSFQTQDYASAICISGNGKVLAISDSLGRKVVIVDIASGRIINTFKRFTDAAEKIAVDYHGKIVAIAIKNYLKIFDISSKKLIKSIGKRDPYEEIGLSQDGKTAYIRYDKKQVEMLNVETGKVIKSINAYGNAYLANRGLLFSHLIGEKYYRGTVYNQNKELLFPKFQLFPRMEAVSQYQDKIYVALDNKSLQIWDLHQGTLHKVKYFNGEDEYNYQIKNNLLFAHNNKKYKTIDVWDLTKLDKKLITTSATNSFPVSAKTILVHSRDNNIYLKNLYKNKGDTLLTSFNEIIFAGLAERLLFLSSKDKFVVMDIKTRQILYSKEPDVKIASICLAPAKDILATTYEDGTAVTWNLKTNVKKQFHFGDIRSLHIDSSSKYLLMLNQNEIVVRLLKNGKAIFKHDSKEKWVKNVAFSQNGRGLLINYDQQIQVWDIAQRKHLVNLQGNNEKMWLVTNAQMFFDCSTTMRPYIHMTKGLKLLDKQKLEKKYRPQLLKKALANIFK